MTNILVFSFLMGLVVLLSTSLATVPPVFSLNVWPGPRSAAPALGRPYPEVTKRLLDVFLASVGLVVTLPLWAAVIIAIKLESRGSAIYVQTRVGRHGRAFELYKFRSMHQDAERRQAELRHLNEADGPVFKMRRDPRVTLVGRFLRRSSLDELPQLINVLKGEMSMVGPRPPVPHEVAAYRPGDRVRLTVKPGLTCLWQISGRSRLTFDQWMELDREYVARMSLLLDVWIIFRTIWTVVSCTGAY
jgi:lipopolysaccharide/colanic/teichoic acid biosynthesis glycosyltransferase